MAEQILMGSGVFKAAYTKALLLVIGIESR